MNNIIFTEEFEALYKRVSNAYDSFFNSSYIKETFEADSLEDIDEFFKPVIECNDFRPDLPNVIGEVLLSSKDFYSNLYLLKKI